MCACHCHCSTERAAYPTALHVAYFSYVPSTLSALATCSLLLPHCNRRQQILSTQNQAQMLCDSATKVASSRFIQIDSLRDQIISQNSKLLRREVSSPRALHSQVQAWTPQATHRLHKAPLFQFAKPTSSSLKDQLLNISRTITNWSECIGSFTD